MDGGVGEAGEGSGVGARGEAGASGEVGVAGGGGVDGGVGEAARTAAWPTVRLTFGAVVEVRQLLAFSDRVEVVSPPEAREELARAAAAVAELYGAGGRRPVSPASADGRC